VADKHPYMSGSGGVTQAVAHLRKSFPATVSADTLKKLGIASNNETYVLNILRFVGVLDAENKKTTEAAPIFNKHEDAEFQQGFAGLVEKSYHELFELHGSEAWGLPLNKLIAFFRNHDSTSDVVGKRQATTFQTLAGLSGKFVAAPSPVVSKTTSNGQKVTLHSRLCLYVDWSAVGLSETPLSMRAMGTASTFDWIRNLTCGWR
jgi:Family of unknown function (DUF5343)